MNIKTLKRKWADLRQFGIVLLAAGVFFYLGVIIPMPEKTTHANTAMMVTCIVFLSISSYLLFKAKSIQREINDLEEE
ncbi:YrhC family protein [Bacillus sp. B1-b2]|uniref:YrhC family protein n=1 Tax=Bacillus sp. B1-b2 TaxID=2653201 RepID=UPI0012620D09|nr:YrhC family protein [Bacillus sp. B1-b2]KAB7667260.1 hypothetical protein F9279_15445 [Bacillus sp. B1-b2]